MYSSSFAPLGEQPTPLKTMNGEPNFMYSTMFTKCSIVLLLLVHQDLTAMNIFITHVCSSTKHEIIIIKKKLSSLIYPKKLTIFHVHNNSAELIISLILLSFYVRGTIDCSIDLSWNQRWATIIKCTRFYAFDGHFLSLFLY